MVVPTCQPVLLLQGPVFLPLSALLYNLLYVLEQLHSTHLLIATPGNSVSLFSPVLEKFLELAPVLGSGTQFLVHSHLVAHPSQVPPLVPGHGQLISHTGEGTKQN